MEEDKDGEGEGMKGETWDDVDGSYFVLIFLLGMTYRLCLCVDSLLNLKGLQEYILYAMQHPAGGLRDKPPK
jgi:prenyltransferase beta subunit